MKPAVLIVLAALGLRADVVVSPRGSDDNPGTEAQPVRTLEKARTLIRAQRGGTVWLRGGTYGRTSTLTLGPEDSNTVWRSWPEEEARLSGGRAVQGFKLVADRPGLFEVNLREQGITDFGTHVSRGFGRAVRPAALELFFRGRPMRLASWPNTGWAYTSGAPAGPKGGKFSIASERLKRWEAEPDLWVHGYWTYDWADSYEHVASIDAATGVIATDPPHGVYGYAAGKRVEVINALSELDEPGEWYLDRRTGLLTFWPPEPIGPGEVAVSLLETPLVSVTNGTNIHLLDLTFENTRGDAVQIRGGVEVVVGWSRLRNAGGRAVTIDGGMSHGVEYCDIRDTGEGGVTANGGDRKTLTGSWHFVTNNHFQRFSRWVRTYRPAVSVSGVSQRVMYNRIHHAPHEAIALSGNDHLIEGNDIHTAAYETADVGAFYMGRDWTWRGNVLRSNFFHNQGNGDVNSIYLDDCASGTLVENNYFHRAGRSVFIGGGRDNIVRGNVFVEGRPAVEVDARGLTWAKFWFNGQDNTLMDRLAAMPYKDPPWSERYPELVNILNDEPAAAKGNVVEGNSWYGGAWSKYRDGTEKWVQESGTTVLEAMPALPLDAAAGDVVQYRVEAVAGKPNSARLIVENLGPAPVSGEVLLWTWPEGVGLASDSAVRFELSPGDAITRELPVTGFAGFKEVWVGARLKGDDLRPLGLKLTPR
ncbi:MAG: right-handed parallel beta-helix repeat-containing protein [Acidobacteria bacterium]|nr:right-handed parallel beta-helix repeat-containing protein [Acidobacteriota bacterium]